MAILNGNKYALPFDNSVKLMKKTSRYAIYRYFNKKWMFAIIVGKNVVKTFDKYHEAKGYAQRKYDVKF